MGESMTEETTLLAHLIPRITSRAEDSATDALAFILNNSEACREALGLLFKDEGFGLKPLNRFRAQVTYDDGSRPDMVGYDDSGEKRIVVESKFWADFQKGQASGYFTQLEAEGPGLLLFIAPDKRIDTLWHEIRRQMNDYGTCVELELLETLDRIRKARITGSKKRVMLVSWTLLLDNLLAAVPSDSLTAQDIRQLRGFAQMQDAQAFLPVHSEELAPSLPRRIRAINDLVDEVVDGHGVPEGWISTKGRNATPQREGYGRYFRSVGGDGEPVDGDFFLCVNYRQWATQADTPLWLWIGSGVSINVVKLRSIAARLVESGQKGPFDVPIYLMTGVEKQEALNNVVCQVRKIVEIANE